MAARLRAKIENLFNKINSRRSVAASNNHHQKCVRAKVRSRNTGTAFFVILGHWAANSRLSFCQSPRFGSVSGCIASAGHNAVYTSFRLDAVVPRDRPSRLVNATVASHVGNANSRFTNVPLPLRRYRGHMRTTDTLRRSPVTVHQSIESPFASPTNAVPSMLSTETASGSASASPGYTR